MEKHGLRQHPLYRVWINMKARCNNSNHKWYHRYGGRGISIWPIWERSFKAFYTWAITHGYGTGLTLDRIDNDGNYEPGNCRFTNRSTSMFNRGRMKNNTTGYAGVTCKGNKYQATLGNKYLGLYDTPEQASKARKL